MVLRHEGKMPRGEEENNGRASVLLALLPSYLLFFALCFVYVWLAVEPHLIYHCFGTILPDAPLFATGWPFLRDALGTPGGPVVCASGFLSLGYHQAWLGAAIIVLAGFCLSELARRHLAAAGFARAFVLASLPAIIFFLIYSRYRHPLTICLTVSLGLLLSLILERLPVRQRLVRVVMCCFLAAVSFWLGGGGTLLVFALMTVAYRILVHWDWTTVALALPASVAIVWALAEYVFLLPARQALLILTPLSQPVTAGMDTLLKVLIFLLYGFVPLVVALVLVGKRVFAGRGKEPHPHPKKAGGKNKHVAVQRKGLSLGTFTKPALAALPVVLMALGLYLSNDGLRKPYVLSNYYWHHKKWDKIVELSRHLPRNRNNVYVSHDTIRALYHTGRLPYDMFRCPLIPEAILLTHEKGQSDLTQVKLCDIWLELGYVNTAEKLASEVLTTKGHFGIALEELGWISIIKGHPGTARVYLNALKKDPIRRRRAKSLLHGLGGGFEPDRAASIERIRSCMFDEPTGITGSELVDETLAALLKHNPRNKMAFEYLMACYLLTGRVDKIAENVDRLPELGYRGIPTLYEEAICIHYGSTGRQVDLTKIRISPETLQRYEAFVRTMGAVQTQDRQAVLNHLIRDFGTSYFFYYTFGRVGVM